MLTENQINGIINTIKNKYNPTRIYIFGSYAAGNARADSDLDLLVIKDTLVNKRKELIEMKKDIISKDYSIDILLFSEDEFLAKKDEGWRIIEEVETYGKIVQ